MANTASTAAVLDHSGTTGFRAWVAEIIAQLLSVGLTQTADTGQINTSTVTIPGVSTSAGYAIFSFNDSAQATTPVFFKIEFGTGGNTTSPDIWITVGTGSNGSGTINGVVMTRVNCGTGAIISTTTAYNSRYVYNPTMGFCAVIFKIGSTVGANMSMSGFVIFRSTDSAGAVTTDSVMLITNSASAAASNSAKMQVLSHLTGTAYNTVNPIADGSMHGSMPFSATATFFSGNGQVGFIYQATPILGIYACMAVGLLSEIGLNSTTVLALIGATTHTFLNVGMAFGSTVTSILGISGTSTFGYLILWE